jgi:hypothetical protein
MPTKSTPMIKPAAKKSAKRRTNQGSTRDAVRYSDVLFEFPDVDMRGTVIVRKGEMVIEISEQNGLAGALVVGKKDGHLFRGSNDIRDESALAIDASWCDFGEAYAGIWIEEGNELLFSFRLPR